MAKKTPNCKTIFRTKQLEDFLSDMPDAFYQDMEAAFQVEYEEMIEEAGIDDEDITDVEESIDVTISITYKTKDKKNG